MTTIHILLDAYDGYKKRESESDLSVRKGIAYCNKLNEILKKLKCLSSE